MDDLFDADLEVAEKMKEEKRKRKEKRFAKLINKKDLNSYEMDEMFVDMN